MFGFVSVFLESVYQGVEEFGFSYDRKFTMRV